MVESEEKRRGGQDGPGVKGTTNAVRAEQEERRGGMERRVERRGEWGAEAMTTAVAMTLEMWTT